MQLEEQRAREYRESVRQKEASIRAKAIVRQERFEASLRAKEEAAAEKRRQDEEREAQRLARLEEQKARIAEANAIKREKQEMRVQAAMSAQEQLQRRQRETFEQREAESEERRERWIRAREEYLHSVAQKSAEKREQVAGVLRTLEKQSEKYVEEINHKQKVADENRKSFHQQRRERLDQQAADLSMRLFERHLTVERNGKRDEYVRECLDEKLHQTDERIGSMLSYKQQSLQQRKMLADKAARDKMELSKRVETMRLTKVFELPPEMRSNIKNTELRVLFDMIDKDGHGRISLEEVRHAVQSLSKQGRITKGGRILTEEELAFTEAYNAARAGNDDGGSVY